MSLAVDPSRAHTIEKSLRELSLMAAGSAAFVVVGVWLVVGDFAGFRAEPLTVPVGWLAIVFFGLCLAALLKELLPGERAVLTLSPSGFWDRRISEQEISWSSVWDIHERTIAREKFVLVVLDPEADRRIILNRWAWWTRKANAALYADGLWLSARGLKADFETLASLMRAYWVAYSREHTGNSA